MYLRPTMVFGLLQKIIKILASGYRHVIPWSPKHTFRMWFQLTPDLFNCKLKLCLYSWVKHQKKRNRTLLH